MQVMHGDMFRLRGVTLPGQISRSRVPITRREHALLDENHRCCVSGQHEVIPQPTTPIPK